MAANFVRTLRSLEHERTSPGWFLLALAMLLAWSCWLFRSSIHVYVASSAARFEVSRPARVAAPKTGRIISLALELGREVREDEVLVELDGAATRRQREQLQSELRGIEAQVAAVSAQIAAEARVRSSRELVNGIDSVAARHAAAAAERTARHQARLAEVAGELHARAIVSNLELEKSREQAAAGSSQAQSAESAIQRLRAMLAYDEDVALARSAGLASRQVELEARAQTARLRLAALDAEIEKYRVRAALRGRLASTASLRVGDLVREGDWIATVIPASRDVHVVAELAASEGVGRVLPGQPARVRLAGFPWTDYGALDARVTRVASEPSDGSIRVELSIDGRSMSAIPVQHGLTGTVEIQVETATPWSLLVRMFGRSLTTTARSAR